MARDLICLSHLRWDFVYQRPNHLMARAARDRRVFFVEEPFVADVAAPTSRTVEREGVRVVTPLVPAGLDPAAMDRYLADVIDELIRAERVREPVLWYYTPMALPWTRHLPSSAVVYDSMDYLAGFRGAPPRLLELETELLGRADLVFTGGASLQTRMAGRHRRVRCFPSSIDVGHFRGARRGAADPVDQEPIARPRLGYAGVIDERIDLDLVDGVASARPDWSIVLVGPTAKIGDDEIPDRPNIHRLGLKPYADLPQYLAGWNVGWMPFARNEATRFISPTKTPEYLAAGLPVVSTSIHDVIEPYGRMGFASIADTVDTTIEAVEPALAGIRPLRAEVDAFLARGSWDRTWATMDTLIAEVVHESTRAIRRAPRQPAAVPARLSVSSPSHAAERVPVAAASRAALD